MHGYDMKKYLQNIKKQFVKGQNHCTARKPENLLLIFCQDMIRSCTIHLLNP